MQTPSDTVLRTARRVLVAVALAYALFAGLRTVADFDTGWQLAAGRYVVQHHTIPGTDVFSYTASGNEWIYPPLSGVLLYFVASLCGYAGLSWLCALACVASVALALRKGSLATGALAVLAVPSIAYRTGPRADLFTTLLFAAFLGLLWRHHRGERVRLWPLPLLMICWVNLHPGFAAGLGLLVAYLAIEALELPFASRRASALERLRRAWRWLALTVLATLLNPWGLNIYAVLVRQNRAMDLHAAFIGEWSRVPVSPLALRQLFDVRTPESGLWWLMLAAVVAVAIALWRRQFGAALLLAVSCYAALQHLRMQGLFAIVVVVVGGALLEAREAGGESREDAPASPGVRLCAAALAVVVCLLTLLRVSDLVSGRYYAVSSATSTFGAGESWWFPERAAAFIERERLPGNIFHEYAMGGFVTWRLGPHYPDYIDGRAIPFGPELFIGQRKLLSLPPDSAEWQAEADRRGIDILLFSLARFGGLGSVDLAGFCGSATWRPIYMDEVSVVLLRNTPSNRSWIDRLAIDCRTQPIEPPTVKSRAVLFNFYSNAAGVYYILGRDSEAIDALDRAESLFPADPNVHLTRAQLFQSQGRWDDAEREYHAALARKQTDAAWYALGRMYGGQRRYAEAETAFDRAAQLSPYPHNAYKSLAQVELALQQPRRALDDFALAEKYAPYRHGGEELAAEFYAQLAEGRAEAWRRLTDLTRAIDFQRQALRWTPGAASRWSKLADLYTQAGQGQLAEQARRRSQELQDTSKR